MNDFLLNLGLKDTFNLEELNWNSHVNPSVSQKALEIARRINPLFENQKQKKALMKFLMAQFPTLTYGKSSLFSDNQRQKILDLYKEDNQNLFKSYMPDFPTDFYSSIENINSFFNN
jgi:hypothetical protein